MAQTTQRFFPGGGCGYLRVIGESSWAAVRARDPCDDAVYQFSEAGTFAHAAWRTTPEYRIARGYFPMDTRGLPASGITVQSASLNVRFGPFLSYADNDAYAYAAIVESTITSTSALVIADWQEFNFTLWGSEDLDTFTSNQYNAIPLNATGLANINGGGWTKLGLLEGHDQMGDSYAIDVQDNSGNGFSGYDDYYLNGSGIYTPYLEVKYTYDVHVTI